MPSNFSEPCPACTNEKDNHLLGTGQGFTLYYACMSCGHHYIIDGSKYVNEEAEVQEVEHVQFNH